jgi:hypothetical protein
MAGDLTSDGSSFMCIIIKDKHYKINPSVLFVATSVASISKVAVISEF